LIVRCWPSRSIVARAKLKSTSMKHKIMNHMAVMCVATSALALSFLVVGCAHEVSHTKKSSVSSNGTVKSTETTVTESPDGTLTKTEESKKTTR
jgi:hypothetical protein